MKREAIIEHIMSNVFDELDIIRDALEFYYAGATNNEINAEFQDRQLGE